MADLIHSLYTQVILTVFAVATIDVGVAFLWRALRESGDPAGADRD